MKAIYTTFLALVFGHLLCAVAQAQADLNAPVTDHPTVASEIIRGVDATFDCSLSNARPRDEEQCVFKAQHENQQVHSSHESFDAGLYFQLWIDHEDHVDSDRSLASSNSVAASYFPDDERTARDIFPLVKSVETKARLTDEQIISVLHITAEAKNQVRARLLVRAAELKK